MTTQQIANLESLLNRQIYKIENTYYIDLSSGGSYLLPLVKINKTAGWVYTQTWEKIKPEIQNYIIDILQEYGREAVSKKKNRIVSGYSNGCETLTIIPAATKYIVWEMDLLKNLSEVQNSYSKFLEFEY